jgi:hypothetical protein
LSPTGRGDHGNDRWDGGGLFPQLLSLKSSRELNCEDALRRVSADRAGKVMGRGGGAGERPPSRRRSGIPGRQRTARGFRTAEDGDGPSSSMTPRPRRSGPATHQISRRGSTTPSAGSPATRSRRRKTTFSRRTRIGEGIAVRRPTLFRREPQGRI